MSDVTRLIEAAQRGETHAASELLAQMYAELRALAAQQMVRERPEHTLQATALVHEAWLRLVDAEGQARFQNRAHFFGAAAEAMRRILIGCARRRKAQRRGGGQECVDLEEVEIAAPARDDEMLAVDEALEKLSTQDPAKAELVKLRYFAGLTIEQAASVLGISTATAKRHWTFVRVWLYREIRGD